MTSSNPNIFSVTGLLWGDFNNDRWIPPKRQGTRKFKGFLDLRLNKRLSKQSRDWWFETPSRSLWCHCNIFQPPGNYMVLLFWSMWYYKRRCVLECISDKTFRKEWATLRRSCQFVSHTCVLCCPHLPVFPVVSLQPANYVVCYVRLGRYCPSLSKCATSKAKGAPLFTYGLYKQYVLPCITTATAFTH